MIGKFVSSWSTYKQAKAWKGDARACFEHYFIAHVAFQATAKR